MESRLTGSERAVGRWGWPLAAFYGVFLITVGWWSLALWPVPGEVPAWLAVTRAVCFAAGKDGLPGRVGWMLLIGQPLGMYAFLAVVWGRETAMALRVLAGRPAGGAVLLATGLVVLAGGTAAGVRVVRAAGTGAAADGAPVHVAELDGPAPPLDGLLDERGDAVSLERFRGRPVLVTFAFGGCETVCPLIVRDALRARDGATGTVPVVLVVTLDPWRDTPDRLPRLAAAWGLDGAGHALGGPLDVVNRVLDDWSVPRERNLRTGEVVHLPLIHVIDAGGRHAYRVAGVGADLTGLLAGLAARGAS
jgi:cytochrome oxidase Cu insertion factor (SCO1/SenC/PrrC family)